MSVYTYPQSKLINKVTFHKTERGAIRAYLHANSDATPEQLRGVVQRLHKLDYQCIPYTYDGEPALEVRGFKHAPSFISVLEENKWATGPSTYTAPKEDLLSFKEKLKKRSLQASGWAYAWGDASFFLYGLKDSSPLDMAAGIFYGLPTPVLMAYGKNDQSSFQIKKIAREMVDYVKKEGANLPPECSLQSIMADHKKGLIKTMDDLFTRYPSEFMNLCYAAAGTCIGIAGAKHLAKGPSAEAVDGWLKHMRKAQPNATREMAHALAHKNNRVENWLNLGVGTFTVGSGLFGTIVKEKAPDPDAPEKKGLEGVWEWVQERPLTITGAGLMVSTFLHAISTAVAMKGQDAKHKQAVPFRVSFVISALIAEFLVAISSKGHGKGVKSDDSVDGTAIAIAADLIVKQPAEMQDVLIDRMAHFLGRGDVLAMKNEEAHLKLRHQVEALRKNPWSQLQSPGNVPTFDSAPAKTDLPTWQAKMAIQDTNHPQPQLSA